MSRTRLGGLAVRRTNGQTAVKVGQCTTKTCMQACVKISEWQLQWRARYGAHKICTQPSRQTDIGKNRTVHNQNMYASLCKNFRMVASVGREIWRAQDFHTAERTDGRTDMGKNRTVHNQNMYASVCINFRMVASVGSEIWRAQDLHTAERTDGRTYMGKNRTVHNQNM